MAKLIVTPRAERDVEEAIADLGLPDDTWVRIGRSRRPLGDIGDSPAKLAAVTAQNSLLAPI